MKLTKIRDRVNSILGEYHHAKRVTREEKANLFKAKKKYKDTQKAQKVVQSVAQGIQQEAHKQITSIVTRCLKAVFDNPYTFDIEFVRKRGKTEALLHFVDRRGNKIDPANGTEGGALDVASFALRLSCIMLQKPQRRKILIADEPFKFVSDRKGNRERVRELIELLSEELDFQFIIVTHDRKLEAGKVIDLTA